MSEVSSMTVDELYEIGESHRRDNLASGMTIEGVDFLTRDWIVGLIDHQGLPEEVGRELWLRWFPS